MANIFDSSLQNRVRFFLESGTVIDDAVTIKINNILYTGWQSVTINQDLNSLSSSFSVNTVDKWRQSSDSWPFMPGNQVLVYIGSDLVINGYIDVTEASASNEDRQITFSGRDKAADIIDSAAIGTSSNYKNISLLALANLYLSDFGLTATSDTDDSATLLSEVVVEQGETVFELLSRYAKELGVLLTSTVEGNLLITDRKGAVNKLSSEAKKSGKKIATAIGVNKFELAQGVNVLSATSTFDETERFQTYLVKSQIKGNDHVNAKDSSTINGTAFDKGVKRHRVKYIIAEKSMDNKGAEARAKWLSDVHAIGAVEVEVTVAGWKDADGKLWETNRIVSTNIQFIGINAQLMLVVGVRFNQSLDGTTTTLRLTRADGYQAQPEAANDPKEAAGWDNSILGDLKGAADKLGLKLK